MNAVLYPAKLRCCSLFAYYVYLASPTLRTFVFYLYLNTVPSCYIKKTTLYALKHNLKEISGDKYTFAMQVLLFLMQSFF